MLHFHLHRFNLPYSSDPVSPVHSTPSLWSSHFSPSPRRTRRPIHLQSLHSSSWDNFPSITYLIIFLPPNRRSLSRSKVTSTNTTRPVRRLPSVPLDPTTSFRFSLTIVSFLPQSHPQFHQSIWDFLLHLFVYANLFKSSPIACYFSKRFALSSASRSNRFHAESAWNSIIGPNRSPCFQIVFLHLLQLDMMLLFNSIQLWNFSFFFSYSVAWVRLNS